MSTILIAPLNWGLGHASRCIPIIRSLVVNHRVIIASDGISLELLKNEFNHLEFEELPTYGITYAKNSNLVFHLIKQIPRLYSVIKKERLVCRRLCEKYSVDFIISDNRYGICHADIPSYFISHQLNIPINRWLSIPFLIHKQWMKKFSGIIIPDYPDHRMAGSLSRTNKSGSMNLMYAGILSKKAPVETISQTRYDVAVILSGPEPSRSHLERMLCRLLLKTAYKIVFIRGSNEDYSIAYSDNITMVNIAGSNEINNILSNSKLIICRSGYSSIMDLLAARKKAILIPTKGQTEQEYLADYHMRTGPFRCVREQDIEKQLLPVLSEMEMITYKVDFSTPIIFESILKAILIK